MNCQEFSEHVTEISRARVMDAAARGRAVIHAEECENCGARLERERALSSALRATAESFDGVAAPARVESALLAAFRAERASQREPVEVQPPAPAVARARVLAFASPFGRRVRFAFAASAVAASLILAFVVVRRAPRQQEPAAQVASRRSPQTPAQSPAAQAETAATSSSQSEPAAQAGAGGETKGRAVRGTGSGRPARLQRAAGARSLKKSLPQVALAFDIDGGQAVFAEGDATTSASEVAGLRGDAAALTDFVPISAGNGSTPLDGGQVVRVEAPRAALASLGLPVDPRRAGETVKADLLLGHDGTAHAIRLVR